MTGYEILQTALLLMGYTDANGQVSGEAAKSASRHALSAVRQIYAELAYAAGNEPIVIRSLGDEIPLPKRLTDEVMPYGVAMLLAIGEGDNNTEAAFALIYNRKRSLLTATDRRTDVIPHPEEEE